MRSRVVALLLLVGIILSPLRAAAAMSILIAYDSAVLPAATTWVEPEPRLRPERHSARKYVYGVALDGYDDCDDWVEQQVDALGARIGVGTSRGLSQRIERSEEGFARSVVARASPSGEAWKASFDRDALGREVERRLPGGVTSRWTRDEYGRPIKHAISANDVAISNVAYRWRGPSTIESMVDSLRGESYLEHDARGRLSAVHRGTGATEYRRPDRTGNVYRSADRRDRRYGRGGALLDDRGTLMAYDADGNLMERKAPDGATWRYEWDAAGRMRAAVRPDEKRVEFEYDALSRRVAKRFEGNTVRWLWDGNMPVHEWSNDATVTTWLFEPGSFAPMAKLGADGSRTAIVCDQVGAPELLVDDAGRAVWQGRLTVAGEAETSLGDIADCPWRFPGQYEDAETGLFYSRFRYYDPRSGAYVSQDPLRFVAGRELYAYVPDPTTWIDPLGLSSCTRTGVERRNQHDWRDVRDTWDAAGMEGILSSENRNLIAQGKTPRVDGPWINWFPGDEPLIGERISMHHIGGGPLAVPLPYSRHVAAHMPGGFRFNPGGPGETG